MDPLLGALFVVSRILHVGTAIVAVGGTVFMRFVLMPAANAALSTADHDKLRAQIIATWKRVIHSAILLFLLTGAINYGRVIVEKTHSKDGVYHGLMGAKILLAFGIFFIASALVGKSPGLAAIRANARKWMAVNVILATIIVMISGFLRMRPETRPLPGSASEVISTTHPEK